MSDHRRIFSLWGFQRLGPHKAGIEPTSLDKGVPELSAIGHQVVSIYPRRFEQWVTRRLPMRLRRKMAYLLATVSMLRTIGAEDAIYTTDNIWGHWISKLKRLGIVRNRFIFKWAGFDVSYASMADGRHPRDAAKFRLIAKSADAIILVSQHEIFLIAETFPESASKLLFAPTGVDIDFYSNVIPMTSEGRGSLVAVGSDNKRDWHTVIQLAKLGVAVTLLTDDPRAKQMFDAAVASEPSIALTLEYKVGYRRSAEIMGRARAIILATLPNDRFSGATTVGVAAALRRPLILDEPFDLAAYGLAPGVNCEAFERGNASSALAAVRRVFDDSSYEERLSQGISSITDRVNAYQFAEVISMAAQR